MKQKKKNNDLPKVEPVKIKPLFGLQPGVWLTIIYAIAILLLIFLVGFLPDILNGSKRVTFTSNAGTVAVYVDGSYIGGTPFTRKVSSGTHDVQYKVNGYEIDSFAIKVGHPVFFNWLIPRTQTVTSDAPLTEDAFNALSKEFLEDINLYSAILEYDSVHRYPNLFTEYAKSIQSCPYKNTKALEAALLFITTDEMLEDAQNALNILGLNTANTSTASSFTIPYQTLNQGKTVGLQNTTINSNATNTSQLKLAKSNLTTPFFTVEGFTIPDSNFSNGKTVNDTYPEVTEAGTSIHTDKFNIGSYCITEKQYSIFIEQNPMWALANKENLIAQGLVDKYYLDGVTISTSVTGNRPVRNISWYAAEAFCQWLSSITNKKVYLPTENQWIAASLKTDLKYQRSLAPTEAVDSPSAMLGGVWEMTGTEFIPLSRIADIQAAQSKAQSKTLEAIETLQAYDTQVDMVIKGGSYVLGVNDIDQYSVGTTYRSLCSDFMGFRIAWN